MARKIENKTYVRWTFPCWIGNDLEETVANSYRTRSELLDNLNSDWRLEPREVRGTCNCMQEHHPIRVAFVLNRS